MPIPRKPSANDGICRGIERSDTMSLTVKSIDAAKPLGKGYKLADSGSLYLYITPAGVKSWRANCRREGKQATRTYGQWPAVPATSTRLIPAVAPTQAQ